MRKLEKLVALILSVVMLCCMVSLASAEATAPEGYPEIITDADGKPVDLGGIEVIIADYWSATDGTRNEATDAKTEETYAYQDWLMETYNFTIKQCGVSDWAGNPEAFLNFATSNGAENYIFMMRPDAVATPMASGLLYDLGSLDCLDFTKTKWNSAVIALMSKGASVYGTAVGASEPRQVIFFNKRLVEEAGIDPESIYDLQKNGEWTWDKYEELVAKCTRDTDNDGATDIYGMADFSMDFFMAAVASNNGTFFDVDENGQYVVTANSDETLEALNWAQKMFTTYEMPQPSDDTNWDWFRAAFTSGKAAFFCDEAYQTNANGLLSTMEDDFGMVCFPTGPKNEAGNYKTISSENVVVMPSFYDAERAWKIAFAYNLFTNDTPGYELELDPDAWKDNYYNLFRDERAVDETYATLRESSHTAAAVSRLFGSDNDVLGSDFIWSISGGAVTPAEAIETKMPAWQAYLDTMNSVGK